MKYNVQIRVTGPGVAEWLDMHYSFEHRPHWMGPVQELGGAWATFVLPVEASDALRAQDRAMTDASSLIPNFVDLANSAKYLIVQTEKVVETKIT